MQPVATHLSIRSYSRQRHGHAHDFHQLVLPLRGVIEIEFEAYSGNVAPGECVLIRRGQVHHFTADTEARFVVADMDSLPGNLAGSSPVVFSISPPLIRYLDFIEAQLQHQLNPGLEQSMSQVFAQLLAEQRLMPQVDQRIRRVLRYMAERLEQRLAIHELARVACLSETQCKKLFREQVGMTVMQYLTQMRMDRARALLQHTDYSIQRIAEQVGYTDVSAFSRRFSACFGMSPTRFAP